MKAIETDGIITSITSKGDHSLGFRVSTPELSVEEKAEFMRLQNMLLKFLITPLDVKNAPRYKIEKGFENKSPSLRLRNTLYVLWEQGGGQGEFDEFYRQQMEKFIDIIKDNLS